LRIALIISELRKTTILQWDHALQGPHPARLVKEGLNNGGEGGSGNSPKALNRWCNGGANLRVGLNGGISRRAARASDAMPWRHPEGAKRTKGMPLARGCRFSDWG